MVFLISFITDSISLLKLVSDCKKWKHTYKVYSYSFSLISSILQCLAYEYTIVFNGEKKLPGDDSLRIAFNYKFLSQSQILIVFTNLLLKLGTAMTSFRDHIINLY